MEIVADIKLRYCSGETISTSPERLDIIVKFKEDGRMFRRKLIKTLVTTKYSLLGDDNFDCYGDYLSEVDKVVGNREILEEKVVSFIKEYFNDKQINISEKDKYWSIMEKIDKNNKFKVKVKIK